jgi:hypothetical protein
MNASSGVVHEASSLLSPMLILDAAILAIIAAMIHLDSKFFCYFRDFRWGQLRPSI